MSRFSASQLRRITRGARRADWYASPWRIAGRALGAALVILVLTAVAGLLVVPRLLGGDSLTVLSGSMEPTFSPGDVVVVRGIDEADVCEDVGVGTIISFFPEPNDPTLITHRVVGKTVGTFEDGTRCRLITQGDANSSVDEPVSPAQVRGVFLYGVPGLGWVRQWAGEHPGILIGGVAAVLIGAGIWSSLRAPRRTVVTIPRTDTGPGGTAAPGSTAAPGAEPDPGAAPPSAPPSALLAATDPASALERAQDRELRERELALRERELELREREFALAQERRESAPDATTTQRSEA